MQFAQQQKYEWFKEAYNIQNHPVLEKLESIMRKNWHHRIEPSVKISRDEIDPFRFNLWFWDQKKLPGVIRLFMEMIRFSETEYNVKFNLEPYRQLFDEGMKMSHLRVLAIGVDLRPKDVNKSRLKIGVALKNDFKHLTRKHYKPQTGSEELDEFFYEHTRLIGFDFGFDGSCRTKIYPGFDEGSAEHPLFAGHFSEPELELLAKGKRFFYSVVNNSEPEKRVLTITILGKFLKPMLAHEKRLHWTPEEGRYIFSFLPTEMKAGKIKHFNLYYWE